MAKAIINTGTVANDGTGDTLRAAGGKINDNFGEIYTTLGNGTSLNTPFSGAYNDLSGKPTLFDGAYSSLSGTPTIPADVSDLTDTTNLLVDTDTLDSVLGRGNSSNTKMFIGSQANSTRFPASQIVISEVTTGAQDESVPVGILSESASTGGAQAAGVYGVGYTDGATAARGVVGEGHPATTTDSGSAIGVQSYAHSAHTGGMNIGLYASASGSSVANYALFMSAGNIRSVPAQTWQIVDNNSAALSIDATGKTGILKIETTNGVEGVSFSGNTTLLGAVPTVKEGAVGDKAGTVAVDATYLYVCTADYTDGLSTIWTRTALSAWV